LLSILKAGHEQAGYRPAVVLSSELYNRKVGLSLLFPITSQVKGYPFEVALPAGLQVSGVILADQVKSLDWKARRTSFCCTLTSDVVHDVLNKLGTLLDD
jgi:mRNA interferase MazF